MGGQRFFGSGFVVVRRVGGSRGRGGGGFLVFFVNLSFFFNNVFQLFLIFVFCLFWLFVSTIFFSSFPQKKAENPIEPYNSRKKPCNSMGSHLKNKKSEFFAARFILVPDC